ncbi:MAG: ATP-binding protein [Eubacteriales bacterium]|nr:ATP-binding protein [Eubacteriales bacterium]
MTRRIFRGIVLTAIVAVLITSALTGATLYAYNVQRISAEMRTEAGYLLHALNRTEDETSFFAGFVSDNRTTLISPDGTVLYDSGAKAAELENHADRPEFQQALAEGSGSSERYSSTLAETTHYYAVRTDSGNVLRIASTQSSIIGVFLRMIPLLVIIFLAVVLLSLGIARFVARRIVAPVNELNLDQPLENDVYDELSPLLLRMERQREEIDRQMRALTDKQSELTAITENMREGLVLLNPQGVILSMNGSAAKIFGVNASHHIGEDVLSVSRNPAVREAIHDARSGKNGETILENGGRYYQLLASPVAGNGGSMGIVLLLLDTTEKYTAEISRREFSANVSHELKTPLTSISGFAEIIRDGLARPEDVKDFAGRICREADRLVALITDIMELSRLDERKELGDRERVGLRSVAEEVVSRLEEPARAKDIDLRLVGEECAVSGYSLLLGEMVYNLVDNAIKYSGTGGHVVVRTGMQGGKAVLSVTDDGIGIPREHQSRVFERFYRVDKSHSKATGGTGLGLSIVKHGAAIHEAEVELESEPGKGTCVRLIFRPAKQNG